MSIKDSKTEQPCTIHSVMASALYEEIGAWSKNAFPDANSIDHLQKLKHEAQEAKETPYKIEEYADCMIALLAAAWKADIAFFELIEAVESKLEVNKKRNWKKLSDGTYQHLPLCCMSTKTIQYFLLEEILYTFYCF